VKETAFNPEGAFLIGALTVEALLNAGIRPYAVGGLTLGADPLATAVSLAFFSVGMTVPAFIVRKEAKDHGTLSWIEGAKTFPKNASLVVLEDVTTTGGSSLKAVDKLHEAGFQVSTILTVVDRLEGARKSIEGRGLKFISLTTLIDIRSTKP
jgi:orotate phosphoribosyltransferase